MDTYAVNLGKVVQGDNSVRPVYRDARAFFEATYLTTELRRILTDVFSVLAGKSGDRVLQLRTPFGGGKTHSLLSLYHLAHSRQLLGDLP
jgi:predicted AAA+ superfamily ATPase